jgi:hypothetical protein
MPAGPRPRGRFGRLTAGEAGDLDITLLFASEPLMPLSTLRRPRARLLHRQALPAGRPSPVLGMALTRAGEAILPLGILPFRTLRSFRTEGRDPRGPEGSEAKGRPAPPSCREWRAGARVSTR